MLACDSGLLVHQDADSLVFWGEQARDIDGDLPESRRWFEAAHREARRVGDWSGLAWAALGLTGVWLDEHRYTADSRLLRAQLHEALALIDPADSLAVRIRVRLAAESDFDSGRHAAILAMLDQARAAGPVARLEALSLAHQCLLGPDRGPLRRSLADELVAQAARADRRGDLVMGQLCQVVDEYLAGDSHAPCRLAELQATLAQGEHLAIGYVGSAIEVMLAIRAGRLAEAERLARYSRDLGNRAGGLDAQTWYRAQLVTIRWYQGRLTELVPMLTDLVSSPEATGVSTLFIAALGMAAASTGDRRGAATALAMLPAAGLADLPKTSGWLATGYAVIEAAHLLEDRDAAAGAYQLMRPFADLPMIVGHAMSCYGSVHHALGVACLTTGDVDAAIAHFREAVHRNLALCHWPAVAAARMRYAQALLRRGCPADTVEAAHQQAAAHEETRGASLAGHPDGASTLIHRAATCVRQGRSWRIDLGARSVQVGHSVGMLHLAVLTANAGAEIAAIDLVAGVSAMAAAATRSTPPAQPILDRTATLHYRQRLAQLREEIETHERKGDPAGAASAQAEHDWIVAELAASTGLGGRSRAFSDNRERARLAVGRAIRRAIAHIERSDAFIGGHLRASVHTGASCWYRAA